MIIIGTKSTISYSFCFSLPLAPCAPLLLLTAWGGCIECQGQDSGSGEYGRLPQYKLQHMKQTMIEDEAPGRQVGKKVGEGALGEVFKVEKSKEEVYAIKRVNLHQVNRLNREEQLKRQINIMKNIEHPNIVKFLGEHTQGKHLFMKMEFVEGQNLNSYLLGRKFESLTWHRRFGTIVTLEYLKALGALREKMVINRDIKPDNIMVSVSPQRRIAVKMVDFGEAKHINGHVAYSFLGTKPYMAPEVFRSQGYDENCDIWSLGVTLFQIFQGKHPQRPDQSFLGFPFNEGSPVNNSELETYFKDRIKDGLILSVDLIPDPIRKVMRGMLREDPIKRMKFIEILSILVEGMDSMDDCLSPDEIGAYRKELDACIVSEKLTQRRIGDRRKLEESIKVLYNDLYKPISKEVRLDNKAKKDVLLLLYHLINRIRKTMNQLVEVMGGIMDNSDLCLPMEEMKRLDDYFLELENFLAIQGISRQDRIAKIASITWEVQNFISAYFRAKQEKMLHNIRTYLIFN